MMIQFRANKDLGIYKEGEIITVDADKDGNVHNDFIRRRLKDSVHDNCISLITPKAKENK